MTSVSAAADIRDFSTAAIRQRRFNRVAISCVFGDPLQPGTWSGAPRGIAAVLQQLGIEVEGIAVPLGRAERLWLATRHLLSGQGIPRSTEQLLRQRAARRRRARQVAGSVQRLGIADVLHMGTLDLPALDIGDGVRHYIYCDQTWDLSLRYRPDADRYGRAARQRFDQLEGEALRTATHVFTAGAYVRDNLVTHYGVPERRVTTVGAGMGPIEPYGGPKDYTRPRLLFVAKHLFQAKGGLLLLEAFRLARAARPDLKLTMVGDEPSRRLVPADLGVEFHAGVPWERLQQLYRDATLLVQPMLNDPWGQVYLEALLSRTPVIGLDRNGLPEILEGGRHGLLVDRAEPPVLARRILEALSNPARLAAMGATGQRHVQRSYSWDLVGRRIAWPGPAPGRHDAR